MLRACGRRRFPKKYSEADITLLAEEATTPPARCASESLYSSDRYCNWPLLSPSLSVAAAAAGFVNFMGYLGAYAGDQFTGQVVDADGWRAAVWGWAGCAFAAAAAVAALWNTRGEGDTGQGPTGCRGRRRGLTIVVQT